MKNLDALFKPKSVAVIGASSQPGKVGHDIFSNLLKGNFAGTLYPVNPNASSICSVKAYKSLLNIQENIDLGIIILPPELAKNSVREAIKKGINAIVIVSAGFKEVGNKGAKIERYIADSCREAQIPLVGPNCLGVINPIASTSLNASFSTRMPSAGNVSFISQSGALCSAVLDFAAYRDFGFSKFISIGNKADVDELDLLKYMHKDPDTEVIMLYLEELQSGSDFIKVASEITGGNRPTPILAIKSGRTIAGAKAAASHTGSLAGSEAVYQAIFDQSGIIRVNSINELFDFAIAFAFKNETAVGKLKRKVPHGNRIAIVTNAGGPGIVATDMTVISGLKLAKFTDRTIDVLKSHLPITANVENPVDIIGDAAQERYNNALSAVIRDDGVDGLLVILTPQSMTDVIGTAKIIVQLASKSYKPILSCFMGVVDVSEGVQYLQQHGIPVYRFPESAAKALGALYKYSQWLNRQEFAPYIFDYNKKIASDIIQKAIDDGKKYIGEIEGLELLRCYGFNVLSTKLATDADSAVSIANQIGFPVVMKIVSPQIIHKSDAGGVMINIMDNDGVINGFLSIIKNIKNYNSNAEITGIIIQKMAHKGQEVILGMNRDITFGPLLMFGSGGIFVEIFRDVAFRFAPLRPEDVRFMIRSTKGYKILQGFRGSKKCDLRSLEEMLAKLSTLVTNHPEIEELDINPLLVHLDEEGTTVADCRFIIKTLVS